MRVKDLIVVFIVVPKGDRVNVWGFSRIQFVEFAELARSTRLQKSFELKDHPGANEFENREAASLAMHKALYS